MRLIDADALKEKTLAHGEKIAYVVSFLWDIDDSPTITAIPVEWLETMLDKTAVQDVELNNAIFQVLVAWTKVQEART